MKLIKFLAIAFLVPSIFIFTSCLDSQIPEASDEALLTEIEEQINTPTVADAALDNAEAAVKAFTTQKSANANGVQKMVAFYPIVTKLSEGDKFPKVYEINYGDNYYDAKNNLYRGIITYTEYSYKASKYDYTEFYINQDRIEGYKQGDVNQKGVLNLSSDITTTNLETKQSTNRYTERVRTTTDNNKTETDYTDDSYEFTGYSKGTALVKGEVYDYNFGIEKPLQTVTNYKYFVSGNTYLRIGKNEQSMDYGNGEVDNLAVRTINGKERNVVLNWGEKR